MGLETFTYISSLNASNPTTGDNKTEGDDHIRGIKSALLATFPDITGAQTFTGDGAGWTFGSGSAIYDASATYVFNGGPSTTALSWYIDSSLLMNLSSAATLTVSGLIKGNGGGSGLGAITISTSAASGGSSGDVWFQY